MRFIDLFTKHRRASSTTAWTSPARQEYLGLDPLHKYGLERVSTILAVYREKCA